jgi:hypothetical protein
MSQSHPGSPPSRWAALCEILASALVVIFIGWVLWMVNVLVIS